MRIDISTALMVLTPTAMYTVETKEGVDTLIWEDTDVTQPSLGAIGTEVARLQAEYDAQEYSRNRAADYPSIADQLDTLYHGGIDAWKAEVKVVKDKYPKV